MSTRRNFFKNAAAFSAGILGVSTRLAAQASPTPPGHSQDANHSAHHPAVITPDVADLPYEPDGAVKVFQLRSEVVRRKIAPFKTIDAWGYNGTCPGPTIQIRQGDRVRVIFENRLPESTTVHWHGLEIPIAQDGVPWISQKPIPPGEKYTYEFTVHQEGTFFYHAHSAMQEMMGQIGLFIAHPEKPYQPRVDHDYAMVLQEWAVLPSNSVPNSAGMEFNWHHPIHLHGNQFVQTGTEGGRAPESSWYPMNTVLVGVAQARVIEFDAKYPGSWMVHCHLPHHMMNNMMDLLRDRQITTADQTDPKALSQMQTLANTVGFEHMHHSPIADNADSVKGFPQDAFMEMGMDQAVEKPETHGLPANWSAEMMGMMTLIRVLPDDQYDEFLRRKNSPALEGTHEHDHNS